MKFDPTKNEDYDEDLAKIGKDNYYSDEDSDKEDEDD